MKILNNSSKESITMLGLFEDIVGGNVEVANNPLTGELLNELCVEKVTIADNLRIVSNTETSPLRGVNFEGVLANHVGGNAELLNNTISEPEPVGGPEVSRKAVTKTLNCVGNVPPPFGKENTANQELGQCAPL